VLLDTHFDLAYVLQGQVSAALEFRGDQPVLWICRIVLPLRSLSGVAGRFQIALESLDNVVPLPGAFFAG
jgi:hypothetical protein